MFDRGRIHFLNIHAVKHGAFAKTAILPGEDRREFEELHSALIEEWAPVGPTEEDAVLSIAKGVWRKRRLQKFLHAEIEMCRSDREHPLYDEAQAVRTLLNTLETGSFLELMEPAPDHFELDHIETVIRLVIESAPSYIATIWERMCPREQFKSASDWLAVLRQVTSSLLRGLEDRGEEPDVLLDRSAKVHTPDVVNHELAVDERIDAMIDRAVKRLVQTKAMKQMLVSTSPRAGDDQPPKKIQTASLKDQEEHSPSRPRGRIALESICGGSDRGWRWPQRRQRPFANALAIVQPDVDLPSFLGGVMRVCRSRHVGRWRRVHSSRALT